MERLTEAILHRTNSLPEGAPVSAKMLLHLGTRPAIDQSLSRLARRGKLLRVIAGPRKDHEDLLVARGDAQLRGLGAWGKNEVLHVQLIGALQIAAAVGKVDCVAGIGVALDLPASASP